jgi:hypothetical protein
MAQGPDAMVVYAAAEAVGALRHWNPRSGDLHPKFAIE